MLTRLKKIILFIGDLACLNLALFLTVSLRYPLELRVVNWNNHWPHFLVVFAIWLLLLYINDLYNLNLKAASRRFLGLILNTAVIASTLSILYFYLNTQSNITPKTNLVIFIAIFLVIFLLWRTLYQMAIHSLIAPDNLAIIGYNGKTEKLVNELQNNPGAGYQAALIFKSLEEIGTLADNIKEKNIQTIVVCDDFNKDERLSAALFSCLPFNLNFFNYPDFYELIAGKIPVEEIGPQWFLDNLKEGEKKYFNFLKQAVDFVLAIIILAISSPFWPLIAIIIKLTSRGPIFFTQERSGKNERSFRMIKFRSMREENNDRSLTMENDSRITPFGSFLRKTRLDEVPQIINILKGEMSFIGPRPERPELIAELEEKIPFYKTRLLIKPGVTGWDQVSGKYHSSSVPDTLEKLQYDLFYLKQRSIYLDLSITLKTIATMISREGR